MHKTQIKAACWKEIDEYMHNLLPPDFWPKSCLDCHAAMSTPFTEGREEGSLLPRLLEVACGSAQQRAK